MTRIFALFGLLLCLFGCNRHVLPTHTIAVGQTSMLVELAYEPKTRAQGLMYRDSLASDEGMLFMYPDAKPRSFWMKNTRMPLSIAFVDPDGKILSIQHMRPLSTKNTVCPEPAQYALEVNKGWFKANDVKVGDQIGQLPEVDIK